MSSPAMQRRRLKRHMREAYAGLELSLEHFDRRGRPVPFWRYMWLFADFKHYRRIAHTRVGDTLVSTIWDGLDSYGFMQEGHVHLIFETGVHRGDDQGWDIIGRWPDEATARLAHQETVNEEKARGA